VSIGLVQRPTDCSVSVELLPPEPTGLSAIDAEAEAQRRWGTHDMVDYAKIIRENAQFLVNGMESDRVAWLSHHDDDGLMTYASFHWDDLGVLMQLGAIPGPAPTTVEVTNWAGVKERVSQRE
jgi:hypothetical protein